MLTGKARTARIYQTSNGKRPFESWLKGLKDVVGQARILARIERAESGNFGNYKDIRNGLYELREPYRPGYRVFPARMRKWAMDGVFTEPGGLTGGARRCNSRAASSGDCERLLWSAFATPRGN